MDGSKFAEALSGLCPNIKSILSKLPDNVKENAFEIRLRCGLPLSMTLPGGGLFVLRTGEAVKLPRAGVYITTKEDIAQSFESLCGHSVHSHTRELAQGFLTVRGGHRAGLCGTAVYGENGEITGIRDISSVNLRIAREVYGAADTVISHIRKNGGLTGGILIAGPPSSGKTTVLRDLCRRLSTGELGEALKLSVMDERGELAAVYGGIPQNDLGLNTDVYSFYPKAEALLMALRGLSPDAAAIDELGSEREARAVLAGLNAGVPVLATIHAGSVTELLRRKQFKCLWRARAFSWVFFLKGRKTPSKIEAVYSAEELIVNL
ncbi:MAG: Flp pilus assembly complex ATPase component TadA [Oscillospiraceae bacterium]|jgi:stage III sporulation protein AA|nr:Flp pilus assembly complex ATPase component TadA [Oscillospiraceae bacterium]